VKKNKKLYENEKSYMKSVQTLNCIHTHGIADTAFMIFCQPPW